MAIPDYQTCMLPFLRHLADGTEHTLRDAEDSLAAQFQLTPAERAQLLPSGQQGIFRNRIGWARTYLKKALLLESPRRGVFRLTDRGRKVLDSNPTRIDVKYLEQFPEFVEFRDAPRPESGATPAPNLLQSATTPEETIEAAHLGLRQQLAALASRVARCLADPRKPRRYSKRRDAGGYTIRLKSLDQQDMQAIRYDECKAEFGASGFFDRLRARLDCRNDHPQRHRRTSC